MEKYRDYLLLGIIAVMVLLLNKFHWKYADQNIYAAGQVFTYVGMTQIKTNDGKDVYIPVYMKR